MASQITPALIRAEAKAHAAFFGRANDKAAIADRVRVSRANVACGHIDYLLEFARDGYASRNRPFDVVGRRKEFVNADGTYNEAMIAEASLTQPEAYVRAHAEIAFNHHPANVDAAFAGVTPALIRSCKTDGAIR